MRNILILLIGIVLLGECTNTIPTINKDVIVYYIPHNTEFCKKISFKEIIYMSENLIKRTDTIYISDSVMNQIKDIKHMNMVTHCDLDCRIFVKIDTTNLFMDSFGNVGNKNGIYESCKRLALWRYLIKEKSGYYNSFSFKEDLEYDTDINLFGVPRKYKHNAKKNIGYKKEGGIKVVFKCPI